MQFSLTTILPSFLTRRSSDRELDGSPAHQIEKTIKAVAKATRLSLGGRQALQQWTSWAIYATALNIRDPDLITQEGWKVVLPFDHDASQNNLRLFLLRAEESPQVAQDASDAFYKHSLLRDFQDAFGKLHENRHRFNDPHAALAKEVWFEWMRKLPAKDLPPYAVPFEALPDWVRETALFATKMDNKDCSGMPGLAQLDLRYLSAPGINLENCDLRGTNFGGADMPGANWNHTQIHGTILPRRVQYANADAAHSAPAPPSAFRLSRAASDADTGLDNSHENSSNDIAAMK